MIVDYLCNSFLPDREAVWNHVFATLDLSITIRRDERDSFCDAGAMVDRMDELGVSTLVLPTGDLSAHARTDPIDFDHIASRWHEVEDLVARFPGRFAALAVVNPELGMAGVHEVRTKLLEPWVVGLYLHTHSWDRRLDHADYYPYYALCSDLDVPIAMQVGASGGMLPSECAHPMGIDRPALYFPSTRFLLSHIGMPWEHETLTMAAKYANVFVGTGSYPPRRWPAPFVEFLRSAGRSKVVFGTNFPTVGHRHALGQLEELDLSDEVRSLLLGDTARSLFTRLVK